MECFLSVELNSQFNSFKRATVFVADYSTIEAIAEDADLDLFSKMYKAHHCAQSLIPRVKYCTHYLRPKGHAYELPRCDSEMYTIYESSLYRIIY